MQGNPSFLARVLLYLILERWCSNMISFSKKISDIFDIYTPKKKQQTYKIYTASEISNYIINKCCSENKSISNLQLQKILYFLQRKFLQEKGYPLFSDEIEAWDFGPVVRKIYFKFCGFGASPLFELSNDNVDFNTKDKQIIDSLVEIYRDKNPWELVEESHAKGKAWDIVYSYGIGNKKIIPKELIATYG